MGDHPALQGVRKFGYSLRYLRKSQIQESGLFSLLDKHTHFDYKLERGRKLRNLVANIFNRSGLAAMSDLQNEASKKLFEFLEEKQHDFLAKSDSFRSDEYKWPKDPLHCWSRVWEYPYVYHHIQQYLEGFEDDRSRVVADIGCGVTFFPFALAALGVKVICADIDKICGVDISAAEEVLPSSSGSIEFRFVEGSQLPFKDGECDIVYCISVLEHIPNFNNTIHEMARIIRKGGMCVITCDLDLDPQGDSQLNTEQFDILQKSFEQSFELLYSEKTVHPVDMLTNSSSPYSSPPKPIAIIGWQLFKQKIIKPLLGRPSGKVFVQGSAPLAVHAMVLRKVT